MTKLAWDEVGSRRFEAGVSHGVIYIPEGVAWNGLTGIDEDVSTAATAHFLDGIRYLDRQQFSDFSAKITAFTYPDELEPFVGSPTYGSGLQVYGQRNKRFGFSYRTGIGDDIRGADAGYRVHVIYNALAVPTTRGFATRDASGAADTFDWQITTKPVRIPNFRPTAHFSISSLTSDSDSLEELEDILYGTASTAPRMPTPTELFGLFSPGPAPDAAIDPEGGWTMTGDSQFIDLSENNTAFTVRGVRTTHADENEYTMVAKDELEDA